MLDNSYKKRHQGYFLQDHIYPIIVQSTLLPSSVIHDNVQYTSYK